MKEKRFQSLDPNTDLWLQAHPVALRGQAGHSERGVPGSREWSVWGSLEN